MSPFLQVWQNCRAGQSGWEQGQSIRLQVLWVTKLWGRWGVTTCLTVTTVCHCYTDTLPANNFIFLVLFLCCSLLAKYSSPPLKIFSYSNIPGSWTFMLLSEQKHRYRELSSLNWIVKVNRIYLQDVSCLVLLTINLRNLCPWLWLTQSIG